MDDQLTESEQALRRTIYQLIVAVNDLNQTALPRRAFRVVIVGATFGIAQLILNLLLALRVGDLIAGLIAIVVFVITLIYLLRSLPRPEKKPLEERPPWLKS